MEPPAGPHQEGPTPPEVIVCDLEAVTELDAHTLDVLARLHLIAQRFGMTLELHNASDALVDLIGFAGLSGVLVVARSGVEVDRQVEQREQRGIDEEVLGGDGAV